MIPHAEPATQERLELGEDMIAARDAPAPHSLKKKVPEHAAVMISAAFATLAQRACERIGELMEQRKDLHVALAAAKFILNDVKPKTSKGIEIHTGPTFVSNLGLPAAPKPDAVTIQKAATKLLKAPKKAKKANVVKPEAAERPEFGKSAPADQYLPKQSFDVTKIVAATPDRPPTQIVDFPNAIAPRRVLILPDPKAE